MINKAVSLGFHSRSLIYDSFQKFQPIQGHRELSPKRDKSKTFGKKIVIDDTNVLESNLPGGTCTWTWGAGYYGQLGRKGRYYEKCSSIPKRVEFEFPIVQVNAFFSQKNTTKSKLINFQLT